MAEFEVCMETFGESTGDVAADFDTLLKVLRGYVELTRLALDVSIKNIQMLSRDFANIERALERATELAKKLLADGRP